ncbi:unnamed protein product [Rotaria sordida]|uniref:Uncharacterized protein n=1 Tax=Rotaria sordida TaxID=392033 RepID=A0A818NZU2_9BILA|nr:unnamed protein product [Rotaria sordida]
MHMFPFGHVVYMPLSSSSSPTTTLLGPISTDFSPSSIIPLYNTTFLNNPFNLYTNTKFEYNVHRQILPHRFKRIRDDFHDIQDKKRTKLTPTINNSSSTLSKNALMLLHELKPSIEYKLIAQTGPSHRPMFTMAVEINGQVFKGTAQTKKEAKQAAAEKALQSFSQLPFSLFDNLTNINNNLSNKSIENNNNNNNQSNISESYENQNPFYILKQLKQNLQCEEITNEIITEQNEFKFTIIIDDQRFIGIGQNKNIAKTKAAQRALEKLFGMCFHKEDSLPNNLPYSRQTLADHIALCIQEKFKQLTQNNIRLQRRKVLSGIVLLHNYNLETMEIICITTGTKSINNNNNNNNNNNRLIRNGQILHDCHAEILARRCLIYYCYKQLKLFFNEKYNETIFEKISNTNHFQLKSSITFHLYISIAPCGDSRLISQQDIKIEKSSFLNINQNLKSSLKKSYGLLRRKIEVGEGTIPILAKTIYQNVQTWERHLTMSCSDKLCRWNFIGLQGALLSTLINPIYYTSIIIGSLYQSEPIRRALFSRIEDKVYNIPTPYGLQRPFISDITKPEIRNTTRSPNHAFIWNSIDQKCEIIDSLSGLTISREPSMISKLALFHQWINLMNKIKSERIPTIYYDAKQLAVDYQTAKNKVNQAFENCEFGLWIKKSNQHDEFGLSLADASLSSQTK